MSLDSLKLVMELARENMIDDEDMEDERERQEEALKNVQELYDLLEKLKTLPGADVKFGPN